MTNRYLLAVASLLSLGLSGCGHRYIASRVTNPVIEDRVRAGPTDQQKMSIVSTRADRRTILIVSPEKICAEPPPDVAEAVSSQALAELATKDIGFGAAQSSATAVLQLTQKSQGLLLFRDNAWIACNAWITGAFGNDYLAYQRSLKYAFDESVKLISKQIEYNNLPGALGTVSAPGSAVMVLTAAEQQRVFEQRAADKAKADADKAAAAEKAKADQAKAAAGTPAGAAGTPAPKT